jgi:hypothetical protein
MVTWPAAATVKVTQSRSPTRWMLWFWAAALTLIGLAWASVSSTSKLSATAPTG